jgi:hypothetical protein
MKLRFSVLATFDNVGNAGADRDRYRQKTMYGVDDSTAFRPGPTRPDPTRPDPTRPDPTRPDRTGNYRRRICASEQGSSWLTTKLSPSPRLLEGSRLS